MTGHHHAHPGASARHRGRLAWVLGLTLVVMAVEVVGGLLSGSFALVADAGHMLTDAAGLAVALGASVLAGLPPTARRTFGWQRAEVLAALVNGLVVGVVGVLVLVEGIRRVVHPGDVEPRLMLGVALLGLAANAVGLLLLHRGRHDSLNVRGAYLEVLGDALGSVAVVAAALVVLATGAARADGIASVVIALLVLPRAAMLLRDVALVLLEATPAGVELDAVREHMTRVPGVVGVHDLHAWTITSGVPVLSAHVVVADDELDRAGTGRVLEALRACLSGHFDVDHCTFQLEPASHGGERGLHP
ncbi:cation diffusion facilitator family transporter [Cellulomonas flavigena DSM 20109]|uniref:Cation diffusion facilitator family transporter n=1 Tax=Cellulomonas flavigena (strain ATCC 482 / DSM 20109 / BCRC 11376 / JCM 18109 / NBRC 3775 / NCIMB 8073 / NRS 134) TaxID=446466 RepID=D5UKC2_CELFN|nr:cation diffusion facilitator family transporter [Cellulomonas flavigena]ADG75783.1 cation diffusion facilitator family transporter [Cellulomonas flavigena DSM 20109]